MDNFDKALKEFGKTVGKLKTEYAKEYNTTSDDLLLVIDKDNYVSILPNNTNGIYVDFFRGKVDIE